MDKYISKVFKNKKIDFDKLKEFGFVPQNDENVFSTFIMDAQFKLIVKIKDNEIFSQIFDLTNSEPYTLFLAEGATGSFVNEVRAEYEKVLNEIERSCCDDFVFKSEYAQKTVRYIKEKYGSELEFLWEKFPETAIWRRQDNRKWFGLLMTINKRKLGIDNQEEVEVLNLRVEVDEVDKLVDGKTFFKAYHMNKKHWLSICFDGSVDLNQIFQMIDKSFELAK